MTEDDLPGVPFRIKLKCASCGWGFDMGCRLVETAKGGDEERGYTVCSKCGCTLTFLVDGHEAREVRVLQQEEISKLPGEVIVMIMKLQFIQWLAEHVAKEQGPLH